MHKSTLLRIIPLVVLFLTVLAAPVCFAGAHGGGGGFHGGGGGGYHGATAAGAYHGGGGWGGGGYHGGGWNGYHGGGYYGAGYHGGGYYGGWRGGYYPGRGWYGGGWGYPGWGWGGWGFGIGVSFGWGGYWGSYPYYGYPAACSYYYPCYPYYSYPYPYYVSAGAPPATPTAYVNTASASRPAPAQFNAPELRTVPMPPIANGVTLMNASYRPGTSQLTAASYRPPSHSSLQISEQRPAVQNVVRALRAMPPAARERQLASGRYSDFSPQELKFVRYAVDVPATE